MRGASLKQLRDSRARVFTFTLKNTHIEERNTMQEQTTNDEATPTADVVVPQKREPLDITADEIFAAVDHRVIAVQVDEWKQGAFVYIHTPSSEDKDTLEQVMLRGVNEDGTAKRIERDEVRAAFVAMCAKNSKGERLFSSYDDIKRLKKKSIAPMDRIFQAIVDASIITEKDVDEMAKNSGAVSNDIS